MQEKKRRKKSKFGYYLYAIVVLVLTVVNISLATLLLTHVQTMNVSGNELGTKNEIVAWIKEDPLTVNSLYTYWKFKAGAYEMPAYLEDVKVSLKAPWEVQVDVKEKSIIGCVEADGAFVYFDEEGLVLKKTTEYGDDIPLIEGLEVQGAKQFEYLQTENEKVFAYIVNATKEIEKHEIVPDRIVWEEDSMDLWFAEICVKLGKTGFDEKVIHLPPILEELQQREEKKGILHMEHYTSDSKNISFEKNY